MSDLMSYNKAQDKKIMEHGTTGLEYSKDKEDIDLAASNDLVI